MTELWPLKVRLVSYSSVSCKRPKSRVCFEDINCTDTGGTKLLPFAKIISLRAANIMRGHSLNGEQGSHEMNPPNEHFGHNNGINGILMG